MVARPVDSTGLATGMLITALHRAGLATLTHTPSPMKFLNEILGRLNHCPIGKEKPTMIVAKTIKGKGVSFIENRAEWHHKVPDDQMLQQAIRELNLQLENLKNEQYTM